MITIFTIEEMRVHVGLDPSDDTQDAEINAAMEVAVAMAETYCDRKFQLAADVETFTHIAGYSIQLHRYPVISITEIVDAISTNLDPEYHADLLSGVIYFDGRHISHALTVTYEGGYGPTTVPPDLRWALFRVFDVIWAQQEGGSGVQPGTVKSARFGDLQISYETGAASAAYVSGIFPLPSVMVLDKYKRYSA